MADTYTNPEQTVKNPGSLRQIEIKDGSFNVDTHGYLKEKREIRAVKVSLNPATATGIIDEIVITGPGGKHEFGCPPNQVKQGTDLIQACGGPAILQAGDVQYHAKGHGFGSETVKLEVNFSA